MSVFKNGIEITKAVVTITSASSPYTAPVNVGDDLTILCNCITAAITVNLPTAVGNSGRVYRIKKTDPSMNAVTITPSGSQLIDNVAGKTLSNENDEYALQSDNANWQAV
jgi:hypothetical protein